MVKGAEGKADLKVAEVKHFILLFIALEELYDSRRSDGIFIIIAIFSYNKLTLQKYAYNLL